MKRIRRYGLLVWVMMLFGLGSFAQSHEAKQLMLNVEKLSQLKNILSDMKKGYSMVADGYKKVKDVASGNFSLHQVFLDGLLVVSPEVKKYRRVAGIISAQQQLLKEYKAALKALRAAQVFSSGELEYIQRVYGSLFGRSLQNLEDLAMVITSSTLRMDDQQRLQAIDRIFMDTTGKLEFLREFNRQAALLVGQKRKEHRETAQLGRFYGK